MTRTSAVRLPHSNVSRWYPAGNAPASFLGSVQRLMKYLVPSAALSLKQGFGRLIRSRADRGIVAILDGRVSRKGYGKVFLRSLPPATRCQTLDELSRFWTTT